MEVHITASEGTMTARLVGRLDTPAAAEVTQEIQPLLDHASETIVLDCSELTYISSSGLRQLLVIRKEAGRLGGSIRSTGMKEDILEIFKLSGLDTMFGIQ